MFDASLRDKNLVDGNVNDSNEVSDSAHYDKADANSLAELKEFSLGC